MEGKQLKKWLDKLQQDSWQLELLISGFVIFGLVNFIQFFRRNFNLYERIRDEGFTSLEFFVSSFESVISLSSYILLCCLILHVIVRGIWIGAIGLRFVSGDIEFEKFNFSEPFRKRFAKKENYFDNYILRLEKIASILFSYAFLTVFIFLSVILYVVVFAAFLQVLVAGVNATNVSAIVSQKILQILAYSYMAMGLVSAFDFLSLGLLKKIKWKPFAKVYYFINSFVSIVTLSFIWRPLFLNFLDNRKTRFVIVGSTFLLFLLSTIFPTANFNFSSFFPKNSYDNYYHGSIKYNRYYYLDEMGNQKIKHFVIPSKAIKDNYLELFVKTTDLDDRIKSTDSLILPILPKGYNFFDRKDHVKQKLRKERDEQLADIRKNVKKRLSESNDSALQKIMSEKRDSLNQSIKQKLKDDYKAINKIINAAYTIKIDSSEITTQGKFYTHPNMNEQGLLYFIPLDSLENGEHSLTLIKNEYERKIDKKTSLSVQIGTKKGYNFRGNEITIPFYYAGN